ncbi:MAG TPA: hypothetical protein VF622_15880 [Segetibacter sp.]
MFHSLPSAKGTSPAWEVMVVANTIYLIAVLTPSGAACPVPAHAKSLSRRPDKMEQFECTYRL